MVFDNLSNLDLCCAYRILRQSALNEVVYEISFRKKKYQTTLMLQHRIEIGVTLAFALYPTYSLVQLPHDARSFTDLKRDHFSYKRCAGVFQ